MKKNEAGAAARERLSDSAVSRRLRPQSVDSQMRIIIIWLVITKRENAMFEQHMGMGSTSGTPTMTGSDSAPRQAPGNRIDSRRLMSGTNELVIEHAGQEYRLRLTRNDKLILTK